MKNIKLTNGDFVIVDDDDYDYLNNFIWSPLKGKYTTYAIRFAQYGAPIPMHREIMNTPKNLVVDHINHNGLDNRKSNLRNCTRSQNSLNRLKNTGINGYKGVRRSYRKFSFKYPQYFAQIEVRGKMLYLGYYHTPEAAAFAYNIAALENFGEFALLNIIDAVTYPLNNLFVA